ncbi:MAG: hypothetical protein NVV66_10285 [Cellulomonas sp.]|uniref:hypothetical protein n=1 Tax=Cellulomonas sp. TaxID=40001 RepID=UPI00258A0E20|nr:hypothetical protein [Cellulomonas sp.]MCR6705058.1 hypothetical protein [Cellulomonas sp.]
MRGEPADRRVVEGRPDAPERLGHVAVDDDAASAGLVVQDRDRDRVADARARAHRGVLGHPVPDEVQQPTHGGDPRPLVARDGPVGVRRAGYRVLLVGAVLTDGRGRDDAEDARDG